MTGRDVIRSVIWGIASRPARTMSLIICLAAGVTAAVFVGVVISGFSREIDRLAFGAYSRALTVQENGLVVDRYGPPTLRDRGVLAREIAGVQSSVAWMSGEAPVLRGGETHAFRVYGVDGDYRPELDSPIVAGRPLSLEETRGASRHCLIGAEVAEVLGGVDLIGSSLRLNGADCEVVGVLGEPRSRPAAIFAEGVIVPLAAAQRYFIADDAKAPGQVDRLTFFLRDEGLLDPARVKADRVLRKLYGVPQSRNSPFVYGDRNVSLEQMLEQRRMMSRLLASLAGLTIAASLVGFGSLAAASLLSRRRELALRMALGASRTDVLVQIVAENTVIGGLGALSGLVLGLMFGLGASTFWSWPFAAEIWVPVAACAFGIGAGLVAGLWAAARAIAVPPSLAARS